MWDTHQAGGRAQRAAHQRAERTHWSDDQREEWVNGTETQGAAIGHGARNKDRDSAECPYLATFRRISLGFRSIKPHYLDSI